MEFLRRLFGGRGDPRPHPSPARGAGADRSTDAASEAPVRPYGRVTVGINSHLLTHESISQLVDLRARHVRTSAILQFWEGEVPSYRAAMREAAARADAAGLRVVWVLHNTRGAAFRSRPVEKWSDRLIRFAAWTARLPACEAVQLWNEPDVQGQAPFGAGVDPPLPPDRTGREYADHLRDAYPRIKAVAPDTLVVSGATADHPEGRWRGFLDGMMESEPPCDAVAVHNYGRWERVRGRLLEQRRIVGDHAPLWMTECGDDRPDRFEPGYQLECWRGTVDGNERARLAERIYPYCLESDPADPGRGMFTDAGAPRPVFAWMSGRAARV